MEQKFEFFNQLPQDIKTETVSHLSTPDLLKFSEASHKSRAFLKPLLEQRKSLQNFLHHVVRGEHDAVKELLKNNIRLLIQRDQIIDCSKRMFLYVSGFEYALWALDKHMWTAMLSCIAQNKNGQIVFAELLAQYNKVSTEGITYTLHGNTITERHFDFKNILINALQTLVDIKCSIAKDTQWKEGVGGAQKLLPMHIIYEYCSKEPFYPVPQFNEQPESSNQFFNGIALQNEYWFRPDSELSLTFAILKAHLTHARAFSVRIDDAPWMDLDAMTALYEKRTNDFLELKTKLEAQITVENSIQTPSIKLS
ncbi:MAG TPA: F-box protein [Legionella sp.]|nr:F-box protein [Legionella sp.]